MSGLDFLLQSVGQHGRPEGYGLLSAATLAGVSQVGVKPEP